MRRKTSKYILQLLILSSIIISPLSSFSQDVKKQMEDKEDKEKFYQGSTIGLEIAGLGNYVLGSDIMSTEAMFQANLLNKYMPVVEIGFGKTNTTNDASDIRYKTSAPFFRIGADYNFFHNKKNFPGYVYGGLRYGLSTFKYDIEAPTMSDPNYGGQMEIPYYYQGIKTTAQWLEVVGGMKVKIYKGFCMGWSIRYKKRLSYTKHENSEPWYIPGYGKNKSTAFMISYHLMYNLPF